MDKLQTCPTGNPERVAMSQSLPSCVDLLCPRFFQFLLQFCRVGILLGVQKGEWAEGVECLASGPTLHSEPARVAPCLLRRLLSDGVCILLYRGVFFTLHLGEIPHMGPTRPVWFHFGGQFLVIAFLFAF